MRTAEYESKQAFSQGMIKDFLRSPRYYEGRHITKTIHAKKKTDDMVLGSMVHCLALAPENFDKEFALITPEVLSKSGARSGQAWKDFAVVHADKDLVFAEDVELAKMLAGKIKNHRYFKHIMEKSIAIEQPLEFDINGYDCKGIPDIVTNDGMVLDIKTVGDMDIFLQTKVGGETLSKEAFERGYDIQLAFYAIGCTQIYSHGSRKFNQGILVLIETNPPYRLRFVEFAEDDIDAAATKIFQTLDAIEERIVEGNWSDPGEDMVVTLSKPGWMK